MGNEIVQPGLYDVITVYVIDDPLVGIMSRMYAREEYVESQQLPPGSQEHVFSVTDYYFDQLNMALALNPQDDPQSGNVQKINELWHDAFNNVLAGEQLRPAPEPEEPGDYPVPENPLEAQSDNGAVPQDDSAVS